MVAAETVFEALDQEEHTIDPKAYPERIKSSWLWEDLHKVSSASSMCSFDHHLLTCEACVRVRCRVVQVRNIRPYMAKGLMPGLVLSAIDTYVFRGNAPWTLNHHKPDHEATKPAKECKPIEYPAPDGKLSFNLLENVARSGTNHSHDQKCHLTLRDSTVPEKINLPGTLLNVPRRSSIASSFSCC
jgi:electron-transferring-flavoprotein dehydrogenase